MYDSSLDDMTQQIIGTHTSPLRVTVVNAPKQQGGSDCGVFAIICLAFGGDPTKIVIGQARMRDRLMMFFSEKMICIHFTIFPNHLTMLYHAS